ncbi:PREDICTED: sodium channel protein Nach-like [Cyphomyrmex costatus]|uniref:Sodium channel protein Nach n=1 Tax=Cyphomyrmex costatus TaxID=456900 RepID=A0A151IM98_9HYME|nr:PREDICTED: sodium channel protein Nach-like [Cyphomyrmex costatus]KYN06007.1 Sodium channel protein Nach [Cyphomyrmex costatus]
MKSSRLQIPYKVLIANAKCWNILKKQAIEFCNNTGLHGYKYISQTKRSKIERIIWAITVFVSLGCATVLIRMAWNYYATHPTLTVIESTHHGIWNYPFPAITVCDINRISYNLTKKFVENIKTPANVPKENLIQEMRLMNELIIPGIFGNDVEKNFTRLQNIIDQNHLSIDTVMSLITQNCSTLLTMCKWKGKVGQCDKYFKRSLSLDGLCCSFNYYTFPDTRTLKNVRRAAACGFETGMTIVVNSEPNDYYATIIGSHGVKVMIHYSFDYPDYNAEIQLVRLNSQHFVTINPAEMYSKPEVKDLTISTRKCIFSEEADEVLYANVKERNLTFTAYSYHNCLAECRASITRAKCGCIPYYFPQNSTRTCDLKDIQCLKKHKSIFDSSWPKMNHKQNLLEILDDVNKVPCGCIPDCLLYYYPIESSFGSLDDTVYYNGASFSKNSRNTISIHNHSIIHIFFNDLVAFQYRRSVNYSWRNVFASFGGLLGLFAGFSLMSIFEFLYFFIIRVITDACINSIKHSNI